MRISVLRYYVCYSFFFFKQKTAYEMRISDWSSDVCSSDLLDGGAHGDFRCRRRRGVGRGVATGESGRSKHQQGGRQQAQRRIAEGSAGDGTGHRCLSQKRCGGGGRCSGSLFLRSSARLDAGIETTEAV